MISQAVILSLMITGIFIAMSPGNLFYPVRVFVANTLDRIVGKKNSKYVQKPLFSCLPCMASAWGILLSWSFDIRLLLAVCGLNVIISRIVERDELVVPGTQQETEYYDDVPTLSRQLFKSNQ